MGEMADFCNERIEESVWHAEKYSNAPLNVQYEEGLIDESGAPITGKKYKPSGPGKCPVCGEATTVREGKFGKFFGCVAFPRCKGSRNY